MARTRETKEEIENKEAQNLNANHAAGNPQVQIITFEQLIANNIDAMNNKIDIVYATMLEAFKQLNIKFPDKK